ncbi:MAG: T9SS type A sorting domain-containing protein [Chlorobi bacterium]|nr:T9SS type A sorting domain-containing protein [Chlorobiota bacterium]
MKKITILFVFLFAASFLYCQNPDEVIIGNTFYDLQTWRAMQNRVYEFEDGTIGSVWNQAENWPVFPDKGVGYSYYNGDQWNGLPFPEISITSGWATFPSYTAFGENGEICISQGANGLIISVREEKGTGNWDESYFPGNGLKHPVVVTSGPNHDTINLLYLVADPLFPETPAQASRGFIHYARSQDGGQSWDIDMEIPGLGSDEYLGFTIGSYIWAEPKAGAIAFVAGDYLTDLVLMKSTDEGETWQKTIVWEHPYPKFEIFTFDSDTFYCNDGGISVALDSEGQANIAFTLSKVFSSTAQDTIWYDPLVGGVVYWNEGMDAFSDNINALNPYGHPDSELEEDFNLIGWVQDIDGNGQIDLAGNFGTYPTPGLCTMPQITLNDLNQIVVVWSSVNENPSFDTDYRHTWFRASIEDSEDWGDFADLNNDLVFIFSEVVYPSLMQSSNSDIINFVSQMDGEPGLSNPELPVYPENDIVFLPVYLGWDPVTVTAGFEADTTIIHIGDTVFFTNTSYGYPPNSITYNWSFEGGTPLTSNDIDPSIAYNTEGVYDVTLTASILALAANTLLKEEYISVLPLTGIDETEKGLVLQIYPNPGNGVFKLELGFLQSATIEYRVYDLLGNVVANEEVSINDKATHTINLNGQPEGVYFLNIMSGGRSYIRKLVLRD